MLKVQHVQKWLENWALKLLWCPWLARQTQNPETLCIIISGIGVRWPVEGLLLMGHQENEECGALGWKQFSHVGKEVHWI